MPNLFVPLALDWVEIFAVDLLRYFVGAGGVALALAVAGRRVAARRIQSRRPGPTDRIREIRLSIQTAAIFAVNGLGVLLLVRAGAASIATGIPTLITGMAELAAIVVAHDAYFYWTHRWLHSRRVFRRAHLAHHRSITPTPWAAYAFAPAEAVVQAVFLPLFLLLMPIHGIVLFLFLAHMILRNTLGHSGHALLPPGFTRHWLGQWFTTSVHHDLHHSEGRHNFGLYFTWWDRLLATEHPDYHARFEAVARRWPSPARLLRRLLVPLLLAGGIVATPWDEAQAATVEGVWVTEEMDAVVEIHDEMQSLSGRIRWLRDPAASPVQPGAQLFSDFSAGSDRWVGRLLNPRDGHRYRATIQADGRRWLRIRLCRGPICETQMWRRLESFPRASPPAGPPAGWQLTGQAWGHEKTRKPLGFRVFNGGRGKD